MNSSPPLSPPSEPDIGSPGSPPTPSPATRDDSIIAAAPPQPEPTDVASDTAMTPRKKAAKVKAKAKAAKGKKRIVVRRPAKTSRWTAETIMTDPKSPLATADLRRILSNPAAWDLLDPSSRAEILSLFPGGDEHVLGALDSPDARPDIPSLRNDDSFRHDCAAYTENLAEGRFDPDWLECAWSAYERRKMGDFDAYLVARFEEDWQVELPDEYRPRRAVTNKEEEGGLGVSKAAKARDEGTVEQELNGGDAAPVQASNGHSSKESDTEQPPNEAETSTDAPNGIIHKGRDIKDEGDPQNGDPMAVDELQVDGGVDTNRQTPTSLTRKRRRRAMRDVTESEDELA